MVRTSPLVAILLATGTASADVPKTYIGASFDLSNGLDGASELGFAGQVAPLPYLELEGGTIRHDVDTRDHDTWLVTATARAKYPLRRGAFFAGIGMITGEHGVANGCRSSGFINFCGDRNNTFVERHWERAVWLRPEIGGEFALGVFAARMAIAPIFQMTSPDEQSGCIECDDGQGGVLFTMGIHGRLPI